MGRLTKYGEDGRMKLFTQKDEYGNEIIVTIDGALRKLAHYEDLEEQGRLIEQKRGEWKIHGEYYFCTNCYSEWKEMFPYCPCCGSKNAEEYGVWLKELEGDKE